MIQTKVMMTKFTPAKNSKLIVTSASLSAMFAIVGGLGYNQQIATAVSINTKSLELKTPIEVPIEITPVTKVAQSEIATTKKVKKDVVTSTTVPAEAVTPNQTISNDPAPVAPVSVPVVVAPEPAAPVQAATGGS